MKKYLLLLALVCLLGNRALAQTKSASNTSFTHEVVDFTGFNVSWEGSQINWGTGDFSNYIESFSQNGLTKTYTSSIDGQYRISVSSRQNGGWNIGHERGHGDESYLQKASNDDRSVFIHGLNVGDIVKMTIAGECRIMSDNTATCVNVEDSREDIFNDPSNNGVQLNDGQVLRIVNNHNDGTMEVKLVGNSSNNQYPGIIKIEIDAVQTTPRYDYDKSLEVYDMYQTRNDAGNTAYSASESAGFTLNNSNAYYLKFTNNDLTLNERLAVSTTSGWTFARGIQAPNYSLNNDSWYNLSICNLREGDRVVIYYTGDAPTFSSNGKDGDYTGSAAFKDTWNDGMLDTGEGDHKISVGDPVEYTYCRDEGTIAQEESTSHVWIYTSYPYVMMENGHLDLAIRNGNRTRIVKIKIYSDHQAMMVDDYNNETYTYTAYYNITGELQAKEHIVPGGLEVHVGNDNASQHANVVFSKEGPVSYVKAVDGFKLPGITKVNGAIQNDFNLASHAPETGTYYKFIPEADGKMTVRFKAASLNYYRWNLPGDAIYFDDPDTGDPINGHTGWSAEFDRANEWPVDRDCPYYLKVMDGNQYKQPAGLKVSYDNGNSFSDVGNNTLQIHNGEYCTLTLDVKAGKTYYLYGAWSGSSNIAISPRNDNNSDRDACGVAQLLWVEFAPENKIYPLAKWVPNNTSKVNDDTDGGIPNPDTYQKEYELADVIGYVGATITVKKMSGNITACRPYIKRARPNDREGKLMIDGIQFAADKNPGGTILIKIGDPEAKTSPLYALTIAYSAEATYDKDNADGSRGHTWDLTTNSLYGMKWDLAHNAYVKSHAPKYDTTFGTSTGGYATPTPMGTYFKDYYANEAAIANFTKVEEVWDYFHNTLSNGINTGSLLEEEIDYNDHHGITRSDWSFSYNLVYGDKLYDPIFSNKYDMEGDNADMIWDTEGTVIRTSANQSVIFNEFTGTDIHSSVKDPDRYVGIKEGGEFRIPWLMPNDRVIIWMGTGKGAFNDQAVFNIRGAYDAVHNEIKPEDEYIVGGSHWDGANGDNNYRGCYHFFAQGGPTVDGKTMPADMVFKMVGGNLCKIYKIQIYRGDRIITNEVVGAEGKDKFLLWSRAADPNDANDVAAIGPKYNWTLKYFGKDQKLADGTNSVNNDIVAWTGAGISTKTLTTSDETDPTAATYNTFTFQHDYNTIGTFRARGKDMEKNMKYVADYGEHNVTVAHQQTMKYPYTWDLMDMTGWSNNATRFINEDAYGSLAYKPRPEWFDNDTQWNASYEKSSTDLSLFGKAVGNDQGYVLRLNSQETASAYPQDNIFESVQTLENNEPYYGNQFWRDGEIVPESQGLWFHTLDQSSQYGSLRAYDDGMSVAGSHSWRYNMVVPNVPKDAAVYMRIKKARELDCEASYKFAGSDASELTLLPTEKDDEYIVAIKNDKGAKKHLTLSLAGYQMKKLSVSTDPKKLNIRGWATESRDHVIDPELTAYLTGKDIETCIVTGVDYANKTITLTRVYSRPNNTAGENTTAGEETTTPAYVMRKLADGGKGASILHNKAVTSLTATDGEIKILDGGFHLFVPDMHDYDKANDANGGKTITDNNSMLVARVTKTTSTDKIPGSSGNYTNYALTYKHFKLDADGNQVSGSSIVEGTEAFYRIAATGASSSGNQGYLPLETKYVDPSNASYGTNPSTNNNGGNAKFSIIFEDEFENINPGITTTIDDIESSGRVVTSEGFYNLNGQKINGIPTQKGMYIVNGKKVLVK